ncbi:MAG: hypothetical protein JMDDDDMK_00462 [Acidobacteria bacterium]|nr:hypothetical protein [Acidobacteriota bacterium]
MARDRASLLVEDDLFVDVSAFVEHPVGFDEAAVKDGLACGVNRFKLDPGFVKVADFGRE